MSRQPEDGHREFTRELLRDLQALRKMIDDGMIESDITRIGAEQELFLVDKDWMPSSCSEAVLKALNDDHYTTELAKFNMEINLDPELLGGNCLTELEKQLRTSINRAQGAANSVGASVILSGILPTLTRSHATLDHMTPTPRYQQLNETMTRLRGGEYDLRIKGLDELLLRHGNVMLEACNTSLQVHLQIAPSDFVRQYNVAQLIAGPVLATMTNSPLLFDRQLWSETRIALFQQATDERSQHLSHVRSHPARVSFGGRWLARSAVEAFEEDIACFRPIFGDALGENAIAVLADGGVPELRALRRHNGTIYRWNRPCYGVSEGKPHLRIECRYIPSGPTIVDEVANAALWLGLMRGMSDEVGDPSGRLPFTEARGNFLAAARTGLGAQFQWIDGNSYSAQKLLLDQLIPIARQGLAAGGCDGDDVTRYIDIIEKRVENRRTGSWWLTQSHAALGSAETPASRSATLVRELHRQQVDGDPVHTWDPVGAGSRSTRYCATVEQLMSTDLFTVRPDELIHLAAHVMDWKHVRHVPVEDETHCLVGLISHRVLMRTLAAQ
ncbi:MAG: CBS domain-containing protein, partial [Acidobacteriota bacterium]|nr:CBS domain-containing protein [Acidobacteriota bacterium]